MTHGVAEVARRLGISRDAVRKAIGRGAMLALVEDYHQGGLDRFRYLVSDEEIERYRREHLGRRGPRPTWVNYDEGDESP